MARIVLTGASSFLGRALLLELMRRGEECYAIVRPQSKALGSLKEYEGLHIVLCDMEDDAHWKENIPSCDVFFHLGWDGIGQKDRADPSIQQVNVRNAIKCVRGAAELGARRFLFSGSQAEYGIRTSITDEQAPCHPVTEYGKGKLRALEECAYLAGKLGMDYVHMRIFSVYGPNDHPWALVPDCIRTLLNNSTMELSSCTQMWNYLHVADAARCLCELGNASALRGTNVLNVASSDTRILREFVEEIWVMTGKRGHLAFGERKNSIENPVGLYPNISKLLSLVNWRPCVQFSEGIHELIVREEERL